jgi:ribonuclease-3
MGDPIEPGLTAHQLALIERCQAQLGYTFKRPQLLYEALTHASGARHRLKSNERLEFLGDAALGFVVCELLYRRHPDWDEGELTRVKSAAVSRTACARFARQLRLADFLVTGKGMDPTLPPSLLANVFESIVAAIYLDGGWRKTRRFLLPLVRKEITSVLEGRTATNYKSLFQQRAQRDQGLAPTYVVLDEKGPEHSKCFKVSARLGERLFPAAWGTTKKEAQQRAAANALAQLARKALPYSTAD